MIKKWYTIYALKRVILIKTCRKIFFYILIYVLYLPWCLRDVIVNFSLKNDVIVCQGIMNVPLHRTLNRGRLLYQEIFCLNISNGTAIRIPSPHRCDVRALWVVDTCDKIFPVWFHRSQCNPYRICRIQITRFTPLSTARKQELVKEYVATIT